DAADVSDLGAGNREGLGRLLVEIHGNAGKRALLGHRVAVVPVEHRAPRIGVAVARGTAEHGKSDGVGILDQSHGRWIAGGSSGERWRYSTLIVSFPVRYSAVQIFRTSSMYFFSGRFSPT